jgi:hypothetical protein
MCYVNSPPLASLRAHIAAVAGGEVERLLRLHGSKRSGCVLYCQCRRGAGLGRVERKEEERRESSKEQRHQQNQFRLQRFS